MAGMMPSQDVECASRAFNRIVVWDEDTSPSVDTDEARTCRHFFWNRFQDPAFPEILSLPAVVERDAEQLKSRLLAWIHDLGNASIRGRRVVDALEIRPGFSYWWMTLLAEKSIGKMPRLYDALRLLALETLANDAQIVVLVSTDATLASALSSWCDISKKHFEWHSSTPKGDRTQAIGQKLASVFAPGLSIVRLARYAWQRRCFAKGGASRHLASAAKLTFVDSLIHLSREAFTFGRFVSNYWTELIPAMANLGMQTNWLHLFVPHESLPDANSAKDLLARFNLNADSVETHICLDEALNLRSLGSALRDFCRLVQLYWTLREIESHFRPSGSDLDFWPLFKRDWEDSMLGAAAIFNCLSLNVLERQLKRMPKQQLGVYLQENQPWEMAFIYCWRRAGHNRLIGVPHATVRYWDLRYFHDARSLASVLPNGFPVPDTVAVNGPVARKAYLDGGYPSSNVVEVEALRYWYLSDQMQMASSETIRSRDIRVLICGDIIKDATVQMLRTLELASHKMPSGTSYIVKSHPACPIDPRDYPSLKLRSVDGPLYELFLQCDVVLTTSSTSAAVDAYCCSKPLVQFLDPKTLNLSPLRGLNRLTYATGHEDLANALSTAVRMESVSTEAYFCLDKALPRWNQLIGMELEGATNHA